MISLFCVSACDEDFLSSEGPELLQVIKLLLALAHLPSPTCTFTSPQVRHEYYVSQEEVTRLQKELVQLREEMEKKDEKIVQLNHEIDALGECVVKRWVSTNSPCAVCHNYTYHSVRVLVTQMTVSWR